MVEEKLPVDITVSAERDWLSICWSDGSESRYTASQLRRACRSSASVRARINGVAPHLFEDIRIVAVKPVGHYAISLAFTDGHDRGIYPWQYLWELDGHGLESPPDA